MNFCCCLFFFVLGIHPTTISEAFQKAVVKAVNVLTDMSMPVELSDRESLLKSATTSLCSKVSDVTVPFFVIVVSLPSLPPPSLPPHFLCLFSSCCESQLLVQQPLVCVYLLD